ncbi:hypothetical protein ACOME3_009984 [Neoechinorhynchus agilis]
MNRRDKNQLRDRFFADQRYARDNVLDHRPRLRAAVPNPYRGEACYATISESGTPVHDQTHRRNVISFDPARNRDTCDVRISRDDSRSGDIYLNNPSVDDRHLASSYSNIHETKSVLRPKSARVPDDNQTYLNEASIERNCYASQGRSATLPHLRNTDELGNAKLETQPLSPQTDRRECFKDYRSRAIVGDIFRHTIGRSEAAMSSQPPMAARVPPPYERDPRRSEQTINRFPLWNESEVPRQAQKGKYPKAITLALMPEEDDELHQLYGQILQVTGASRFSYKVTFEGQEFYVPKHMVRPCTSDSLLSVMSSSENRSPEYYSDGTWCQIDIVAEAQRGYSPMYDGHLHVDIGDVIVVREISPMTRMAKGYNMGQYGKFPFEIVRQIPDEKLIGSVAEALFDYEARNSDEISMRKGDRIVIRETRLADPGWWKGRNDGSIGVFPAGYVQIFLQDLSQASSSNDPRLIHVDEAVNDDNPYPQCGLSLKNSELSFEQTSNNKATPDTFSDSLMPSSEAGETCQKRINEQDGVLSSNAHSSPSSNSTNNVRRKEDEMRCQRKIIDDSTERLLKTEEQVCELRKEVMDIKERMSKMESKFQMKIEQLKSSIEFLVGSWRASSETSPTNEKMNKEEGK